SLALLVALSFAGTDRRALTMPTETSMCTDAIIALLYRLEIQEGLRSNPGARKLVGQFFEQRANDAEHVRSATVVGGQLKMNEMAPALVKGLVATKELEPYWKAQAILVLGSLGSKEHMKAIEPFLADATLAPEKGTALTGPVELRDVALAALIAL